MRTCANRRRAIPIGLLVVLAACGGQSPSPASPTPTSFLTGTWTGTVTIQVNPGDPGAPGLFPAIPDPISVDYRRLAFLRSRRDLAPFRRHRRPANG